MKKQRLCWPSLLFYLLSCLVMACRSYAPSPIAPGLFPSPTEAPVAEIAHSTAIPSPTPTQHLSLQADVGATATGAVSGPAVAQVKFALDIDQTRELVFPANEFLSGVTRVYVRFAYQELGDGTEVKSSWYLNDNPVSVGALSWDGGDSGEYLIWIEDPNGLGRGQWRWDLSADGILLGGGAFTIGGEPRYSSDAWGLSFDPPTTWQLESETQEYVTFSSPDQRIGLALNVAPGASALPDVAAAFLDIFQQDRSETQVVATEEVTISGEAALLQHLRYADDDAGEQALFVVAALYGGSAYSLLMLGPVAEEATMKKLLVAAVRSVRFAGDEGYGGEK